MSHTPVVYIKDGVKRVARSDADSKWFSRNGWDVAPGETPPDIIDDLTAHIDYGPIDDTKFLNSLGQWAVPVQGALGGGITQDQADDRYVQLINYFAYSAFEKDKLATIEPGATVNSDDATLLARVNHTGTQSADTVVDGTSNKVYTAAEKTKLAGIAAGATVNSTDAFLRARANHTGTQPSSTISDFAEAVQDTAAAMVVAGTGMTVTYDDAANTLTLATVAGGLSTENVQDIVGALVTGTGLITTSYDDAGNTFTISTSATANSTDATLLSRANHTGTQSADTVVDGTTNKAYSATDKAKLAAIAAGATANATDAQLRDRSTHTGTQSADSLTDGTTNKAFLATERTKLTGIATGATANATDAQLRDRSTHTGTQLSTTISDFTEATQDVVAAVVVAGTGMTATYNDAANTLTLASTSGGLTTEDVQDIIGALVAGSGLITTTYNDAANTFVIATTATANSSDATLLARANHTGTQSADTLTDGTTNKAFLATERTKLAGIATAATANATDAQLRDRSTHTGTQSADTLTDGTTNKAFLATERTKLAGIATGATNVDDTTLVHKTGAETVAGVKTFSSSPVVPDGSFAESAVTGLVADLADKANVDHAHTFTDISGTATLAQAMPGAAFYVYWNGTNWRYNGGNVSARPTARTDLTMIAVSDSTAHFPSWGIAGTDFLLVDDGV